MVKPGRVEQGLAVQPSTAAGSRGVFVVDAIPGDQDIAFLEGQVVANPTRISLTLDGVVISLAAPLLFLNHSCAPNACFRWCWLVARCDIPAGAEITIDYLATESQVHNGFACRCGAARCRGWIGSKASKSGDGAARPSATEGAA